MQFKTLLLALALGVHASAFAMDVEVIEAWVRPTTEGQRATGAFMTITANEEAVLVGVSSPVAGVVEVHEMKMDAGVMKMRAVAGGLKLPAGQAVELKPGGYHIMLMDLHQALKSGSTVQLTLVFQDKRGAQHKLEMGVPVHNPRGSKHTGGQVDMRH